MPQPASSIKPILSPAGSLSSCIQSMSCTGKLVASRQSGRLSVAIISAASATVRVIGPATRPAKAGLIGIRPRLGFKVKMPHQAAGNRSEPPMSVPTCKGP